MPEINRCGDSGKFISLDVGCGLLKEGTVNIDLNPNVSPNAVCDMRYLPFRPAVFSSVNFNHSLEHTKSPSLALEEANRVLVREGIVNIKFPNYWSLLELYSLLRYRMHASSHRPEPLMRHKFNPSIPFIIGLLRKTGFKLLDLQKDVRKGRFQRHVPVWLHFDVICIGTKL